MRDNVNEQFVWNTKKVFIGDICYALDTDIYDDVWGGKYDYKSGKIEDYAVVGGTAWGDGCYEGDDQRFYPVDAGVIGVVDIEHYSRDEDYVSLGTIVEIPSGVAEIKFIDKEGQFYIKIVDKMSGKTVYEVNISTEWENDSDDMEYDFDDECLDDDYCKEEW